MALDIYSKQDIKNVLAGILIAQQPKEEGCRALFAVALAFGCISPRLVREAPQLAVQALLLDQPAQVVTDG